MSITRTIDFSVRYHLINLKYQILHAPFHKRLETLAKAGLTAEIWVPLVALWLAWRIYKIAPRWFSLSYFLLTLMSCEQLLSMGGPQATVVGLFFTGWAIAWVYWFHTVTFRRVRNRGGEPVVLRIKGHAVLPLFYPVLTLRKRFRRQSSQLHKVDTELLELFVVSGWWDPMNPASFYKVTESAPGVILLDVEIPKGYTDEGFAFKAAPIIKAGLHLLDVVSLDEDTRGGYLTFGLFQVNPLDAHLDPKDAAVLCLTDVQREDPFFWLPIGIDASGRPFELAMFLEEGGALRQLVSGESGAGKSSIVRQQLLQACLNPHIDVVITDGKGSEFNLFELYTLSFVSQPRDGTEGVFKQLELLKAEVSRRALILAANKESQTDRFSSAWNIYDDGNMLLWVLDEIGVIGGAMDKKAYDQFQTDLYAIISVARSLGIAVIFSSQTWKSDLLRTQTRDNCFDLSIGFKLNTFQDSDYLGFSSLDTVRPDLISGKLLKSGRWSSVGQFAMRGNERNNYGKSFYISDAQIRAALQTIEPRHGSKGDSEPITTSEDAGWLDDKELERFLDGDGAS